MLGVFKKNSSTLRNTVHKMHKMLRNTVQDHAAAGVSCCSSSPAEQQLLTRRLLTRLLLARSRAVASAHRRGPQVDAALPFKTTFIILFYRTQKNIRKGWLAIAKIKPLSLFISLILMLKKAFDNVEIEK